MELFCDFEFSSTTVFIFTISLVWGGLVMVSLVEETFTDLFCDFWEAWTFFRLST